jgi:hypothetical protein
MTSLIDKIKTGFVLIALVSAGSSVCVRAQEAAEIVLAAANGTGGTGSPSPVPPPPPPSPAPSPAPSPGPSSAPAGTNSPGPRAPVDVAVPAAPDEAATQAAVEGLSLEVQNSIASCAGKRNSYVRSCVADALDQYAAGLMQLKDTLPPQLAGLPDIVDTAARSVRAAKTKKQAVQAVKAAIGAVQKTIALLRADDSFTLAAQTREGNLVAETLQAVDTKLEKAVGL